MRLKVFSLFLAIQFCSFALWQGTKAWEQKPEPKPIIVQVEDQLALPTALPSHEAAKPSLSKIRFSEKTDPDTYKPLVSDRKNELMEVIAKLPAEHTSTLKNLILDLDPEANRGLGGRSIIILRGVNMDAGEMAAVLIHEIGHNVDLGYLGEMDQSEASQFSDGKSLIYEGDPSLEFYRLSWENEQARKRTANNFDFVSGYAMSDPFEDFAESYVYYILHNADFKAKTQTSDIMLAKYRFMKDVVFKGKEYSTGVYKPEDLNRRPWDITVLSYNLENFLNS